MSFTKRIVLTYAKSLFQKVKTTIFISEAEELIDINRLTRLETTKIQADIYLTGEELLLLRALITSSQTIRNFITNPTYVEGQKLKIVLSIFPGLTNSTRSFLKVLTERGHLSLLPEISTEYTNLLEKFKNSTTVKLITATPLKESYGSLLLDNLRRVTNSKEVILQYAYNPKLLGGLIVEYNSLSIDASILNEFSLFFTEK